MKKPENIKESNMDHLQFKMQVEKQYFYYLLVNMNCVKGKIQNLLNFYERLHVRESTNSMTLKESFLLLHKKKVVKSLLGGT